ncbi:Ebp2p KNAG_0C01000 [Huiozyma naganishii CBS 8797]|uniref:rRNA-processing protein EBP2 n=1 Tax=Huiozyma naganishii (strain ATCC MYA-139 / BCRC 22969 / CBS 8797 / KCTC 17520 / NBRC 10181 / NCYC 3082 / Yp74L-3) TaxID=1071383 RepID=J7RI47_HUIN7|nr:hypothetical protein KNAG_0C01000 [Kazachstania naganishii CBS 8797]CCK69213.1 hypothetical protein KNAG_0C01000 [Kazachstania naganishii CBS 8797]
MAKGYKLKELLANEKTKEKYVKEQEEKKTQKKAELKKSEPVVISHDDLVGKKEAEKLEREQTIAEAAAPKETEEYKSKALSKKEQRKLKKQLKEQKISKTASAEEDEDEDEEDEEERGLDLEKLAQSGSESESESEDGDDDENEKSDEEDEEKEEIDVPLSDVEFDSDADVVPHHKLTINNTKAMKHALERVQLPWAKHSFQEHQAVTSSEDTDAQIKDIYDDTERELAFYKQSLDAVSQARVHLKRLHVPFLRPLDYFAEMVKSDEHMDKLKGKLVKEASEKKAHEDARKQRQLKKFGKQVQVATLQKRQLEKKETLEKIKSLKKKKQQNEINNDDFDVGVEEATEDTKDKRWSSYKASGKRAAKNSKYGQGGMKRFKRKNDADSSMDTSSFSNKKSKPMGRPGKSKRSRRH